MIQPLGILAAEIAELLLRRGMKIVFAESCTGGLISATLARIPGASNFHCGSAVVYRLDTKTKWLGIPATMLADPGPVSEPVAQAMSDGVLARTPEADIAVAITGHLGPNSPDNLDGRIYVGISVRGHTCLVIGHLLAKCDLTKQPFVFPGTTEREQRQWMAVEFALNRLNDALCGIEIVEA